MRIEVDYRQLQNESEEFLNRVDEGETFVITEDGKPIADLIPHREGEARRLALDVVE